jgi:hypothetical protein
MQTPTANTGKGACDGVVGRAGIPNCSASVIHTVSFSCIQAAVLASQERELTSKARAGIAEGIGYAILPYVDLLILRYSEDRQNSPRRHYPRMFRHGFRPYRKVFISE